MAFLDENCTLDVLTADILAECQPFECGDKDMDEFFSKDALRYTYYRMGKSYCFRMNDAKNRKDVLNFYQKNGFAFLFPNEKDEDLYTKPPKDEQEKAERLNHPRKLRTRLMFSDLLND